MPGKIFMVIVAIYVMVINFSKVFFIKCFKKTDNIWKIYWDMGRNEKHTSSIFTDRFSPINREAIHGAGGWRALKIIYNYERDVLPKLKNNLAGILTKHWIGGMENRVAVTNRLKVSVQLLVHTLESFSKEKMIRLISIASGSAQAVIEAIKKYGRTNVRVVLIDDDITALEESKAMAEKAGFKTFIIELCENEKVSSAEIAIIKTQLADNSDQVKFVLVKARTSVFDKIAEIFPPHCVEMIGFMDYRPTKKAKELLSRIYNSLVKEGVLLTCNIKNNVERIFLFAVMLWPMIYRDENELSDIVVGGNFSPQKTTIYYEPCDIHGIVATQK
jgi:hypothetical protein